MRTIKGFGSIDWELVAHESTRVGEKPDGYEVNLLFKPEEALPHFRHASLGENVAECTEGTFPEQLLRFRRLLSLTHMKRIWLIEVPEGVIVNLYLPEKVKDSKNMLDGIVRRLKKA